MRLLPKLGGLALAACGPAPHQIGQMRQRGRHAGLAQYGQTPVLRPQHQSGALVSALKRSAFVTRGFVEELIVELEVLKCVSGADFLVLEWRLTQFRRLAIRALPVG